MGLIFVVPLGVAVVALIAIVMRDARTRAAGKPVRRPLYLTVVIGILTLMLTAFVGMLAVTSVGELLTPG